MTTQTTPTSGLTIYHNRPGWHIESQANLTDEVAMSITFRASPDQVTMGALVVVSDPEGHRIGHVKTAEYLEPAFGPGYVIVGINLR